MRDLLGLGHALVLLNSCGQNLSLKHNREIIQLLKGFGGKNISPRVLPPPQVTTCTKYDQRVLHLLAWPEDTNSPEGHFWVTPCRIPARSFFQAAVILLQSIASEAINLEPDMFSTVREL
ncbi:hypothetical protein DV515_00005817 [Chloebia gouldiae]|uniref:Uncharacterized protein n=1 Tax=Chloebia gouldiae TaxID=44316 RepID=A0A3L8SMZ5_CHLGU|nr:hypothetical protein DV515_00005817 [Chloebia gouldiae]